MELEGIVEQFGHSSERARTYHEAIGGHNGPAPRGRGVRCRAAQIDSHQGAFKLFALGKVIEKIGDGGDLWSSPARSAAPRPAWRCLHIHRLNSVAGFDFCELPFDPDLDPFSFSISLINPCPAILASSSFLFRSAFSFCKETTFSFRS